MKLSELFEKCISMPYIQVENAADYAIERMGSTLYIYFAPSDGCEDWKNNIDFPVKPYRRGGGPLWFAHRGFLRVWESVEKYIRRDVLDPTVAKIVTVGYSHGAALAALCHEYIWVHRPDLRETAEGFGFGSPRVLWGLQTRDMRRRWARFQVIRNLDDLITHLPPAFLGYSHVGEMVTIGRCGKYSMTDAHRPENILAELQKEEGGLTV